MMNMREHDNDRQGCVGRTGLRALDRLLLCLVIGLQLLVLWRLRPVSTSEPSSPLDAGMAAGTALPGERFESDAELDVAVAATVPADPDRVVPEASRPLFGWPVRTRLNPSAREDVGLLIARDWDLLQRSPAMDVVELSDAFVVFFSVPDIGPADVSVSMDRGVLTVEWPMFAQGDGHDGRYGRMVRRLRIPGVATDVAQPAFVLTNGFLRVNLPKY